MAIPVRQLVIDGLLSFVRPPPIGTGGSASAAYSYSVFMRHRVLAHVAGLTGVPATVMELGPGESVGTGILSLLMGSERYFGIDVVRHAETSVNLALFDELLEMVRSRAPVPTAGQYLEIRPELPSYAFPHAVFDDALLGHALDPKRLARIRDSVGRGAADGPLRYLAPMGSTAAVGDGQVDWIFSQAVMEHVDAPGAMYRECARCLAPGGFTSHQIDYRCHDTAEEWNGHWKYSRPLWALMRGRRPWFVNRLPHSAHLAALQAAGLGICLDRPQRLAGGLPRARLAAEFRTLSDQDLSVGGAFLVARREA